MKMQGLYKEAQKVDGTIIINPIVLGTNRPVISTPNAIPLNHTDLGANVKVADNACFHKRKPWGRVKDDLPKENWEDPELWFSICVSHNEDPHDIVIKTRHESDKHGGHRLQVRDLQISSPEFYIIMYHMHKQAQHEAVIAEARMLLEAARDKEATKYMELFK